MSVPLQHLEDLLEALAGWKERSAAQPDMLVRVSRPVFDAATEALRELYVLRFHERYCPTASQRQ